MKNTPNDTFTKKYWQIGITFGLTIGLSIYILGVLFGGFLDEKFSTQPLFTIIGTLLAIAASFYRLIRDFSAIERSKKKNKEN
jgi:F0F1-type ATP synthase assembly protein I